MEGAGAIALFTKEGAEGFGSLEEIGGADGVVVCCVDGDVGEGLFHAVEEGGHDCGGGEGKTLELRFFGD